MYKKNYNHLIILIFTIVCFFCIFIKNAFAESIFLKNGSIVEGEIINETDLEIRVRFLNKKIDNIPRKDIVRILFNDEYKKRVYIYKKDGSMINAHIVEIDGSYYYLRKRLNSHKEIRILKNEVKTVSDEKIAGREKNIKIYGWISLGFACLSGASFSGGLYCGLKVNDINPDYNNFYKLYIIASDSFSATILHNRLTEIKRDSDRYSLSGNVLNGIGGAFTTVSIIMAAIYFYKYFKYKRILKSHNYKDNSPEIIPFFFRNFAILKSSKSDKINYFSCGIAIRF